MQSCTHNLYGGSMRHELTGKALVNLIGKVGYSWSNADDIITYSNTGKDFSPPTEAEIDAEIIRLQAEYDAQEYARNRATEYPTIGDQLDMIYKDMKNGTTTHAEAVELVKNKYDKGNPSIRSTQ